MCRVDFSFSGAWHLAPGPTLFQVECSVGGGLHIRFFYNFHVDTREIFRCYISLSVLSVVVRLHEHLHLCRVCCP